ncbi:hypothetical protein SAY87_025446 [Trapa incisa]|uniref:Uncharacterized protein n=1 Tax=Trapa incisa TaxID=236973 RepID=A0AAN7GLG6_9MYRT|nr:hypothetical protein SAY87_025446 [Trapa incisa]
MESDLSEASAEIDMHSSAQPTNHVPFQCSRIIFLNSRRTMGSWRCKVTGRGWKAI